MKTVLVLTLLFSSLVLAQVQQGEEKLPKSGVLSSTVQGGMGGTDVNLPWGSKATEAPPVAGSVSKISDRELLVRLFNNSDKTFAVTVAVVQFRDGGGVVKTDYYSYTLTGKEKLERQVTGSPLTVAARLELRAWKDVTPKKAQAAAALPTAAVPAPPVATRAVKKEGQRSFSPKPPGPAVVSP